jgi:hypothetical protein
MRKFIFFILGVYLLGSFLIGEEGSSEPKKNEFSFYVGKFTSQEAALGIFDLSMFFGTLGLVEEEVVSSTPAFSISYMHDISKRISVGFSAGYQEVTTRTIFLKRSIYEKQTFSFVYPNIRLYYLHGDKIRLYGGIGWGYGGQITIFGLDAMIGKNIGLVVKGGFGCEGVVSAGISGRF